MLGLSHLQDDTKLNSVLFVAFAPVFIFMIALYADKKAIEEKSVKAEWLTTVLLTLEEALSIA